MNNLSVSVAFRFLEVLLTVLLDLLLLTVLLLVQGHLEGMPTLAQSTSALLE